MDGRPPGGSGGPAPGARAPRGWRGDLVRRRRARSRSGSAPQEDYRVYIDPARRSPSAPPDLRPAAHRCRPARTTKEREGISADGALICLRHSEHGDILHTALRGARRRGRRPRSASSWTPAPTWTPSRGARAGRRPVALHVGAGPFERPAIWTADGRAARVDVELPGAVIPLGWWPDGSVDPGPSRVRRNGPARAGGS